MKGQASAATGRLLAALLLLVATVSTGLVVARGGDPSPPSPRRPSIRLPDGSHYEIPPLPAREATRSASGRGRTWQEAGTAYQTGDLARAASLFAEIGANAPDAEERHEATLYRAVSLLMQGLPDQAEAELESALRLADEAGFSGGVDSFYYGLAVLAQGQTARSRAALERALGGAFDAEARGLIARLSPR